MESDKVELTDLIAPGGYLFIAVPDASLFDKNTQLEPFLEFASEHINFFTPSSLGRLLSTENLALIARTSAHNTFYGNHQLLSLSRKSAGLKNKNLDFRSTDFEAMQKYIFKCKQDVISLNDRLRPIVTSQEPITIWGVGQLTARLLANSTLSQANITKFIDSNVSMHGSSYYGRQISSPSLLRNNCETVVVASAIHQTTIVNELNSLEGFTGNIVTLF